MEGNETAGRAVIREFGLSSLAVNNRTVVFILMFMILLGGLSAYRMMPRENFPEVVIPTIYVGTTYAGNSPADIENLVTRPLEKEINTIKGIKKLNSTSIQDFSTIIVEFNIDVSVVKALRDVKDAVDRAKRELPADLDRDPNVFEMDFSQFPIMNINLYGDIHLDILKEYAEYLQDEIEKLSEISEVVIKGALDREVRIDVNVFKMNSVEVSFNDIENAIAAENVTISGGDLRTNDTRRNIRVIGEFKDVSEIGDIIVKHKDEDIVFLKDIADISFDYEDRKSFARAGDLPVVSLDVKKRGGENLVNAADKIKVIIDKAKEKKFPENLIISITNDQSKQTKVQVSNLENSIISGVLLVVLVLQLFMGLRNSMFVGIAIPLSMLMSIGLLNMFGVTLNMMVLFSLILALGMLVDNGIVVVENTYRLMQEGMSPLRAAKEGVGEVAMPVIISTLTTLAAFAPLLFWDDIMGEFMKFLPITLIISLSSSLFIALIINPVLASVFMKVQDERKKIRWRPLLITLAILVIIMTVGYVLKIWMLGNFFLWVIIITVVNVFILVPFSYWFRHNILVWIENLYMRTLKFAVSGYKPVFFLIGMVFLLVFSITFLFLRGPSVSFFPINEPLYVNIFIELPLGSDIEKTNEVTKKVQRRVNAALEGYEFLVDAIITNVGEGTTDPMEGPSIGVTPHKGKITVGFVDYELREGVNTQDVMERIRENVQVFPGVLITVDKNRNGPPVGKQISIEVSGEDYPELISLAEKIKTQIDNYNIPGVEELKLDLEKGKPELIVHVDRTASRRYGVSTGQVASTIRTALFGKEISKFKQGEDDYPIMLRFNEEDRHELSSILNQRITFRDQGSGKIVSIPISSLATIEYTSTYGSIKRRNMNRVITISSNVNEGYNANEINEKIKQVISGYEIPSGFIVKFTGEQQEQAKTQAFLTNAFIISIFLVFLIIVAQFNSLHSPIIIMSSVAFSTIGVFLGLAISKMDIVVLMTGIGIISLAGVVVNNAIVLMDCIDLIRARRRAELGLENQRLPYNEIVASVIKGGQLRLRPVLLTATTTVLGLIPLAIGFNINFTSLLQSWNPEIFIGGDNVVFWGPLSWTIIFGLTFSTFLTLVIVPVMYLLFDAVIYWTTNKFSKTSKELMGEKVI